MQTGNRHKTFWKILSNPATEVAIAIVVVLIAAWSLVTWEADNRAHALPVHFWQR